jgi:hypothetical protein
VKTLCPTPVHRGTGFTLSQAPACRTAVLSGAACAAAISPAARSVTTTARQVPPLLGGGPGVEPVAALLEAADDPFTVLDWVGVVVLERGVHPQHR